MRLLVRKRFAVSPEVIITACMDFPRSKSAVEMAVRRRDNHGEDEEDDDKGRK